MRVAVLGIDLGKTVCSVVGLDPVGAVVLRRRLSRPGVLAFTAKLPACAVAMEACCGGLSATRSTPPACRCWN
jgi:transposase